MPRHAGIFVPTILLCFVLSAQVKQTIPQLRQALIAEQSDSMRCIYNLRLCAAHLFLNLDTALWYCSQAEQLITPQSATYLSAALHKNYGIVFTYRGNYDNALTHDFKAIELYRKINRENDIASVLSNIGMLYMDRLDSIKARAYYQQSLSIKYKLNDHYGIMLSSNNVGSTFLNLNMPDSVIAYCQVALNFADSINDNYGRSIATSNMAAAFLEQNKIDKALDFYNLAIKYKMLANDHIALVSICSELGQIYAKQHQYLQAARYYDMALQYADSTGENYYLETAIKGAAMFYDSTGQPIKAAMLYRKYIALSDSIIRKKYDENIANLETKFGLQQKEYEMAIQNNTILKQEKEIATQHTWMIVFAASALIISLAAVLAWFYFQGKRKAHFAAAIINEQRKGLAAVIQAQDDERTRLGKDLHDGVAQNLTALQLQLTLLNKKLHHHEVAHIVQLAKDCTNEVRDISHTMAPATLTMQGLHHALVLLCHNSFAHAGIQHHVQSNIEHQRFSPIIETNIYRIVQELINNMMKHAQATNVSLHIRYENNMLSIEFFENGIGFDPTTTVLNKHGLYNMKSRAEYIHAQLQISAQSQPNGMLTRLTLHHPPLN